MIGIKNWDHVKCTFCDAASTLRAHEISKMTAQTKRAVYDEVNNLLLRKGSNERRDTGNNNALRVLKLCVPEEENRSEDCIPFNFWKILNNDAKLVLRCSDKVNIGLL